MKVSKFRVLTFVLMLLLAGSFVLAQTPTISGKFEGKVTDDQGNPLPGVTVEATGPKMVGKVATVSDAKGEYRLFGIPSGTYEITYSLQGFKKLIRKDVIMQLSQTIMLNVTLEQSAIEESVTVVGMSPLIDVKSTVKSMTMTKELFMSLPRSRNFDGLLSTVPGVQYEYNTGGLSVDGATGIENMWYMDGADITDAHRGYRSQGAVMELLEEVKISASGYEAQFGGSIGGVVNVITRSGGNSFHGDIYGYYENNKLWMQGKSHKYLRQNPYNDYLYEYVNDDDLYYSGGKDRDPWYRMEGVFSLGGYVVKDKLWFFGSFNPIFSQTKRQAYFLPDTTKTAFFNKNYNWNGAIKLTAAPTTSLRISASFVNNFSKYKGDLPSRDGTSASPSLYDWAAQGYSYPNMSGAATVDYTVSNNFLLSFRGGYAMQDVSNQLFSPSGTIYYFYRTNSIYPETPPELIHFAGWANVADAWNSGLSKSQKREKLSGNLDATYYLSAAGEHAFKFGAQLIRWRENYDNVYQHPWVRMRFGQTCYALPAYPDGFRGTYGYYELRGGFTQPYGYLWDAHSINWALYLQDSWTIASKLTLNAGLRTEYERIPCFSDNPLYKGKDALKFNFGDKLAPRLGAIYDVFGDSSLKVFGSFGIYYDVMKLYIAEGSYGGFKWITQYYTLDDWDWSKIAANGDLSDAASQAAGGTYMGSYDWRIPSFDTTDPSIKPVSQREISFGVEKKLMENLSLSVRLVQKHLIRTIEDVGVAELTGEVYYISNPGFGYTRSTTEGGKFDPSLWATPKAKREYYGMNVTLEKRFSNNWQAGINYTLSRVEGNYGGLASTDENGRIGPNTERYFDLWWMMYKADGSKLDGPLPQDRTHYIKAYGSYAFPFGLTVGVVAYGRSGMAKSTWVNMNNSNWYPNGYGDLGRMPFTFWSDIYLEYTLKFAGKYSAGINFQVSNWTNTKTWQRFIRDVNRNNISASNEDILSKNFDWYAATHTAAADPHPAFNQYSEQFGAWSSRLGLRFSF